MPFLEPNSLCNDLLEDNGVSLQCTSFCHLLQHRLHFIRFPGLLLILKFPALSIRVLKPRTTTYLESVPPDHQEELLLGTGSILAVHCCDGRRRLLVRIRDVLSQ
jgi:hypothetical protein